ncbi:MAG: GntR family transcriptional regulator [bacterium]
MRFDVDITSATPIYAQLVAQVKRALATGALREGEQMPSLRELAAQLRVNPLTVARGYRELEQLGIIITERGRGSYVGAQAQVQSEQYRCEAVEQAIDNLLQEAHRLGVSASAVQELLAARIKQNYSKSEEPNDHE